MVNNSKSWSIKDLSRAGLVIALISMLAQIQLPLPFTPIPISLQSLGVMLSASLLSPPVTLFAIIGYLLLGSVGVPIFTGFRGGFSVLLGPTGGFLIGYLPATLILSIVLHRFSSNKWRYITVAIFHIIIYACGCFWFMLQTNSNFISAFTVTVAPFLLGDLAKSIFFIYLTKRISLISF